MSIPAEAKKVFTGQIFDVYQWEQDMYDGSTATFEMLGRPDTVEIIATKGDQIYYAHQSQPTKNDFIGLFGGRVEEGEEPQEAAKRELREESGMESDDWELYRVYAPYHKMDWRIHVYIARDCVQTAQQTLDSGEKIAVCSASFDEFVSLVESEKYVGRELAYDIMRMRLQPAPVLAEFKSRLFGQKTV